MIWRKYAEFKKWHTVRSYNTSWCGIFVGEAAISTNITPAYNDACKKCVKLMD